MKYKLVFDLISGGTITVKCSSKEIGEQFLKEIRHGEFEWITLGDPSRIIRASNIECITLETE